MDKTSPDFVELIFYVIKSIKALLTNKHKPTFVTVTVIHLEESGKKCVTWKSGQGWKQRRNNALKCGVENWPRMGSGTTVVESVEPVRVAGPG